MAVDPSIYNILNPQGLQSGLQGIAQNYLAGQEHTARLAQLAQQKELQDIQLAQAKRQEALIPQQLAEQQRKQEQQHIQDMSYDIAQALNMGYDKQNLINNIYAESKKRGISDEGVAKLFSPLSQGIEDKDLFKYYLAQSAPEETKKAMIQQQLPKESPFAKVDPSKFTPESLTEFARTKDYTALVPRDKTGTGEGFFAKINPEKFTPESISKFSQSGNYAELVPRKETEAPEAAKKRIIDIEMKMADDYRTESKGWAETSTSMKKILTAIDKAHENPGSALAAGTAFMKILDPGSVVRETELGMALNASGWFDRATNIVNIMQEGRVMTKDQQKQLKNAALDLFEEAKKAQLEIDAAYKSRAEDYGANPKRIITQRGQNLPDIRLSTAKPATAQPVQAISHPQDTEAVKWAKANPQDPRSAAILKMNGVQ